MLYIIISLLATFPYYCLTNVALMNIDDTYRPEQEQGKKTKYANWSASKGLQALDDLATSYYLDEVAKKGQ
jgi:hypothetical protein